MKRFIFLLVLCLASINIYAQRDTIFSVESETPIMLSVPDSVCNPDVTVEQNVIAWRTKKPVALYGGEDVIEFNWFKAYRYRIQKILSFNPITQKNEIVQKNIPTKAHYLFEMICFYMGICIITAVLLLVKMVKKDFEEKKEKEKDNMSVKFYKSNINFFKYLLIPCIIFIYIMSVLIFLGVFYSSYSVSGLFLPALIFLAGVMTPIIVRKIYLVKKQEKEYPEVGGDLRG